MKYSIVIEPSATGYSAYAPDLPGCAATGPTLEAVQRNMREAVAFHIEGLREEGAEIPSPSSLVAYVEVAV